jgi:hypothetical protein
MSGMRRQLIWMVVNPSSAFSRVVGPDNYRMGRDSGANLFRLQNTSLRRVGDYASKWIPA